MNDRTARIVVLLLALAFAVSPFLSNGFGGFYRESFPVQVDRWPAQPAGWAFSIWGVIYMALILAAAWAVWRPQAMPGWGRSAWPLGISLLIGGCCQTNANQSPQGQDGCPLSREETAPLGQSGGTVSFETGSWVEAAFRVEEVVNRGVDGRELL